MLSEEFLNGRHSYRINAANMDSFLHDCSDEGLKWSYSNCDVLDFNPFKFYEGDNIKYIEPVMRIDDRNHVYVKCLYGKISFSYTYDWFTQPSIDYSSNTENI